MTGRLMSVLAGDLWAVVSTVGLVALAGFVGHLLFAWIRLDIPDRLERLLLAAGLGLGLLSYLPFALGIASALTPSTVRIALLGGVVLAGVGVAVRRIVPKTATAAEQADRGTVPFWVWGLVGVAGLYLCSTFVSCLTPMVDYDGLAYHVAAPKRWLETGDLRFLPSQLQTQWPLGTEMLYTLLLPIAGVAACKPLNILFMVLTAGAIYVLGRRTASPAVGLLGASLYVLGAGIYAVPGIDSTSVEVALTLFVVLSAIALAAWKNATTPRERHIWLVLAAVYAGWACCVKLNGLLLCAFLAAAVLIVPRPHDTPLLRRLMAALCFTAVTVLCASPWYLRNWWQTGSPVFPFAYGLLGGRYWSREASAALSAHFHFFNLPGDTLAARQAVVNRHLLKFGALTLVGVMLPGPRWVRALALAAGLYILLEVVICDQWRLMLPALPFLILAFGWWIVRMAAGRELLGWGLVVGLAVLSLPRALGNAAANLPVAWGTGDREAFVRRYVNNVDAFLWANRFLPANARVLYGPDNRIYYLDRTVYWSSAIFQRRIVYDTPQSFTASLQREGITHLILNRRFYNDSAIAFDMRVGGRAKERQRLEEAAARSAVLWEGQGVMVYRLPPDLAGNPSVTP